tara:strand:- start:462 stop:758 length:297 start_codon:yes stop_codon:yes gene_type:complete
MGFALGFKKYIKEEAGLDKLEAGNTTFQRRGYLEVVHEHDVIDSKSRKSIADQLKAIKEITIKHNGRLDESGAVRESGTEKDRTYANTYIPERDGVLQ